MVQEVRKFGERLVLVCRNPGIHKEILRETNQKIAHRLEVPDDVSTVAAMLGLDRDQRSLLKKLPRGVGFLRVGTNPPMLVRFRALAGL
jgi:DNA helicase HerA-like ATPase